MNSIVAKKLKEMEEALKEKGIHFFSEDNVVHTMTSNEEIEITCEAGRYIVVLFDGERESYPMRYRSVNTIMKEFLL